MSNSLSNYTIQPWVLEKLNFLCCVRVWVIIWEDDLDKKQEVDLTSLAIAHSHIDWFPMILGQNYSIVSIQC